MTARCGAGRGASWWLLALGLAAPRAAWALDLREQPFAIRRWMLADRANDLSQASDGRLWFASRAGLVRFDGDRFVDVELAEGGNPDTTWVRRVVSVDGAVWAVTGAGSLGFDGRGGIVAAHQQPSAGLLRLDPDLPLGDGRRVRRFSPADGLPSPWVWALVPDPAGGLWVGTEAGLVHTRGPDGAGGFQRASAVEGPGAGLVSALAPGPEGSLYVGTARGVVVRRDGRFVPTAMREPVLALAADRRGGLWASGADRVLHLDRDGSLRAFSTARPDFIAVDREDNLWVASGDWENRPLRVLAPGATAPVEIIPNPGAATSVTIDREQSVWVTIRDGKIIQLTTPSVRSDEDGLSGVMAFSVLHAGDGSMFVGYLGGVGRLADGVWTRWAFSPAIGAGPVNLAEGPPGRPNGGVWVAIDSRLNHHGPQGVIGLPGWHMPAEYGLRGVIPTRDGDLWVSVSPRGLWRLPAADPSRAVEIGPAAGLCGPELRHGFQASDGSLWFGTNYGSKQLGVTRVEDGHPRCIRPGDGLPEAEIGSVAEDRQGTIWLGTGGAGLVRFRHGHFATVPPAAGLPTVGITGVLDDGREHLWIGSLAGVWRVPKADLHRCADGPCPPLRSLVFGKEQGMRTAECTGEMDPNMALDGSGRVWVATLRGVSVFPPPERNQRPLVTPAIEEITVDGVPQPSRGAIRLGNGRRELVVHYTAGTFLGPVRPRLRHRLVGHDGDWVRAGTPPLAQYRELPPGRYILQLGADGPGVQATSVAVIVEPPFWQTRWFPLSGAALLAALGLAFRRVRAGRLRLRQRAIVEERARIARDLHDGIAQKLTAIGLHADQVRGQSSAEVAGGALVEVRHIVGEAQAELRRAIWDMRERTAEEHRLEILIERVVAQVIAPPEMKLRLETSPSSLPVNALCADETPLLVREALLNAVRHSGAREIEVGVLSDEEGLQIWIRDDGRGFSWPAAAVGRHYGLVGMHERARRMGGRLTVNSRTGVGTAVTLFVPRSQAARRGR